MTAKAYCGRVITEWLSHELILAANGRLRGNEEIRLTCVTVMLDLHAGCSWSCCFEINSKSFLARSLADDPMRNALARFFGILERSGRYLMLGHVSRSL